MHMLIFANGEPNDGPAVRRALEALQGAHIVAADGGARIAAYYGLQVQTVIGDMDSLSPEELAQLRRQGAEVYEHPAEKNETDLELALLFAAESGAQHIRIVGALGGRIDQVLANIYLMALPALSGRDVQMVAGSQRMLLLRPGRHDLHGTDGDTVSLIPLDGDAGGLITEGLQYPLRDEVLHFGPARGISNVMIGPLARVTLGRGLLLLVHTEGRA